MNIDPIRLQEMQQGYEKRIEAQKATITRLQEELERIEQAHGVEVAELRQKVAVLAAEGANLRSLIDATHTSAPQPTDPHSAPAEWHRAVPEPASGPAPSPAEQVLPFDVWGNPPLSAGETAPSKLI